MEPKNAIPLAILIAVLALFAADYLGYIQLSGMFNQEETCPTKPGCGIGNICCGQPTGSGVVEAVNTYPGCKCPEGTHGDTSRATDVTTNTAICVCDGID